MLDFGWHLAEDEGQSEACHRESFPLSGAPPAAAHGWGAKPQTPHKQPSSQPATCRFFLSFYYSSTQVRGELIQQASIATSPLQKHQHTPLYHHPIPFTSQTKCAPSQPWAHILLQHSWWTVAELSRVCHTHQAHISLLMSNSLHRNLLHKHMPAALHWSVLPTCTEGKSQHEFLTSSASSLTNWVSI